MRLTIGSLETLDSRPVGLDSTPTATATKQETTPELAAPMEEIPGTVERAVPIAERSPTPEDTIRVVPLPLAPPMPPPPADTPPRMPTPPVEGPEDDGISNEVHLEQGDDFLPPIPEEINLRRTHRNRARPDRYGFEESAAFPAVLAAFSAVGKDPMGLESPDIVLKVLKAATALFASNASKVLMMSVTRQDQEVSMETARLRLREARRTDLSAFHEFFSNDDVMKYWYNAPHCHESQTRDYLNNMVDSPHNGAGDFVIELKNPETEAKVIGKIGCWDGSEIVLLLNRAHWGKGYASEALDALLHYLFKGRSDVPCVKADVDPRNEAILRLVKRFGFKETKRVERAIETHLGWCDSVYLALERPEKCNL
ncbi:MAG: hypothetical protein M1812_001786 [Candelaria pacifica]|nr:MAG: hypothetical protein M1812_001786 [Candelaria pacifica]